MSQNEASHLNKNVSQPCWSLEQDIFAALSTTASSSILNSVIWRWKKPLAYKLFISCGGAASTLSLTYLYQTSWAQWLINNHSLKREWTVVDIYRDGTRRGKCPPLLSDICVHRMHTGNHWFDWQPYTKGIASWKSNSDRVRRRYFLGEKLAAESYVCLQANAPADFDTTTLLKSQFCSTQLHCWTIAVYRRLVTLFVLVLFGVLD